jgi:hypothetical protein
MATVGNELKQKLSNKYCCEICNYNTDRKSNYDSHLMSAKHKMATNGNEIKQKISNEYTCDICNKVYMDRTGLWKHKTKSVCSKYNCILKEKEIEKNNNAEEIIDLKEIMKYLMKENSEMKNMMMEVIKNGTHNNNSINTTTTNSHNKAFNLNFFLNETCKDAMNIGEFVDSLKLQLSDLEKVGENGYIEGISSIIVKNLKEMDITKRPVHCTDKKRETVYIKDDDKWEKDEDKSKMHKLIKRVVSKNTKMFDVYRQAHPDCTTYHSKFSDQYHKIVYESMGGKGDNDFEKNEKIIKNVLKEVVVGKNS